MKRLLVLLLCVAILCAIPLLVRHVGTVNMPSAPEAAAPSEVIPPTQAVQESPVSPFDNTVTLRILTENGILELPLDEYLKRVLLAEMPADFPREALRAQAVAARTFTLKKAEAGKHAGADICTDPACCQGCLEPGAEGYPAAIAAAVDETDGLVMTYDGTLIDATFFSCSGGKTEAALAVWGSDIPYLQSVDSPGEEDAPRYTDERLFDAAEFAEILQDAYPDANLSGTPESWFGACSRTDGGGVDTVFIGGIPVKGTALRQLFSLRSTDFVLSAEDGQVKIVTQGFGHRVGLSQYGARAMAQRGADFEEILTHYYQGACVTRLENAEVKVRLSAD